MENYNISDSKITASSSKSGYTPQDARLHIIGTAWIPEWNEHQWIQVRFFRQLPITGVITQGEEEENAWVKTYKVRHSNDGQDWYFVSYENEEHEVSYVK